MRAKARQSTVACAAFLVVAAAGCGAGDGSADAESEVRVDTVAGGVERVTNAGDGLWSSGERWTVDLASALELGELDGPEAYTFGRISGVVVGDDGRIYVADADALEIRIFSPEGELLGRFGRDGEGPGEFGYLGGLGPAPGGGVAALDGRLGRVTIFDRDGPFERSFRLERAYATLMAGTPVPFDR
ncbi:MAG: 6-bladed beta-propeller, partial [Gemmatimonadota bacterium]